MFLPKGRTLGLAFFLLFASLSGVRSQENPAGATGIVDPLSFVGLTLDELIRGFGTPRSVYAARGLEEWQDDVVFVYDQGDFYVYKDRVWQVGLRAVRGIKAGDTRGVVSLVLGSRAENRGSSLVCSLDGGSWPLELRCDFDREGRVQLIYIYRTDF